MGYLLPFGSSEICQQRRNGLQLSIGIRNRSRHGSVKTERQGMTFLRSPAVHHISPDALGIVEYAERHNRSDELAPPYSQPSTQLFWDFCKDVLTTSALQIPSTGYGIYYQFDVAKLRWDKGAGRFPFRLISKNSKGFRSRCVILAIGADDCAYVPCEFIHWQRQYPDRILHASQFSVLTRFETSMSAERILIVGGGLTAGTLRTEHQRTRA